MAVDKDCNLVGDFGQIGICGVPDTAKRLVSSENNFAMAGYLLCIEHNLKDQYIHMITEYSHGSKKMCLETLHTTYYGHDHKSAPALNLFQ